MPFCKCFSRWLSSTFNFFLKIVSKNGEVTKPKTRRLHVYTRFKPIFSLTTCDALKCKCMFPAVALVIGTCCHLAATSINCTAQLSSALYEYSRSNSWEELNSLKCTWGQNSSQVVISPDILAISRHLQP